MSTLKKRWAAGSGLLLGTLAAPMTAIGQCTYEATVIRYPLECAFGEVQTQVNGLNDEGWIVGTYWCPIWPDKRPFYRTPEGDYVDFGLAPGSYEVVPADINNTGKICGYAQMSGKGPRGFIYEIVTGEWTIIDSVDPDIGRSFATAINDAGQVCGERTLGPWVSPRTAFIRHTNGVLVDLGDDTTIGLAINADGVVAGRFATTIDPGGEGFIWDGVTATWFGPIPGGITSGASSINNLGEVTVTGLPDKVATGAHSMSYMWRDDYVLNITTLPGYPGVTIRDINVRRQVVGRCYDRDLDLETAILWQGGTTIALEDHTTGTEAAVLESARVINRNGQILVEGHDTANSIVGFLLEPLDSSLGDTDGDCDADIWDLIIVLQDWGESVSPGDLDGNNIVNVTDLLIVLANWG